MAHRGRLNVLVNIMGKRYTDLFTEFEGAVDEDAIQGSGDVKYHLGQVGQHTSQSNTRIDIELAANPSHLEAVDPVVVGMARAYMDQSDPATTPSSPCSSTAMRPSPARASSAETLNLSQVKGYKVGGTIHLIINNQLGYTTAPHQSRSSEYSTDVAKTVQAPIFHVNCRRSRGLRPGGPAGLRLSPAVQQGRGDRHDRLPPPRAQRGRRPELHPADDVPQDRRAARRPGPSTPRP